MTVFCYRMISRHKHVSLIYWHICQKPICAQISFCKAENWWIWQFPTNCFFSHSAPDRNKLFRDKTNLGITLAKYHLETFLQMRRRKVFQNFPHCCSKLSVPTETETFGDLCPTATEKVFCTFSPNATGALL